MGGGIGRVTLDEISNLKHIAGVLVNQAGRTVHKPQAPVRPHFPVSDKFLAVSRLPGGFGITVTGMIELRICRIVVRVSKDNNGILLPAAAPGKKKSCKQ